MKLPVRVNSAVTQMCVLCDTDTDTAAGFLLVLTVISELCQIRPDTFASSDTVYDNDS